MIAFLEKHYKILMVLALAATVALSYAVGFADGSHGTRHGVVLACSDDVLKPLSITPPDPTAKSGNASEPTKTPGAPVQTSGNFVASKNGTKYYPKDCSAVSRIKAENRVWFSTEADAQLQGYSRTTTC